MEWIKLEDQTPQNKEYYWVWPYRSCAGEESVQKCYWRGNKFEISYPPQSYSHWMPMTKPPEPPKI